MTVGLAQAFETSNAGDACLGRDALFQQPPRPFIVPDSVVDYLIEERRFWKAQTELGGYADGRVAALDNLAAKCGVTIR